MLLSEKHTPTSTSEKERVTQAGGRIIFGRVLGTLAVSRSIGDIDYKYPHNKASADFVTASPFVNKVDMSPTDEFLIIACDGLWYELCKWKC